MGDLIKRLFWPKRDYIEILPVEQKPIDKFLDDIRNSFGKVISMEVSQNIVSQASDTGPNREYDEVIPLTDSSESLLIHYKCYRKIKYFPELKDMTFEESINYQIEELQKTKEYYLKHHQNI
jgi:hypothetical protein